MPRPEDSIESSEVDDAVFTDEELHKEFEENSHYDYEVEVEVEEIIDAADNQIDPAEDLKVKWTF
ncbi:hypothetical protein HK100_009023 [Physocladia obscura]|uniref:Uncharacterized protein n=1 Tax=Physocladia obscura TaxID=109957 RepID=A0AAD5T470_9FUNG|nr:hypothetical protein HK100_009023 [Physocladia obscura]